MSDKQLKDKTINIKGKRYVMVKDRLIYFNETYPNGSIVTKLVSKPESDLIVMKATVYPESLYADDHSGLRERKFTGYSQAIIGGQGVNATSALENAETSAVGRALAMMGIGLLESVASADEIAKATNASTSTPRLATPNQLKYLRSKAGEAINSEDLVEINEWLEQLLGMNPEDIVIYKIDDALAKIKAEQDSIRTTANQEYKKLEREVVVTDKDLADFDQGKIPF